MNEGKELIKALDDIEKEKGISKDILLEAIENSLVAACKNEYGKADNIRVTMNRETGEVKVFADKTVVEEVEDPEMEISVADARLKNKFYDPGDIVHVEIVPKNFGRIAAQKAKQVVVQKIREQERKSIYNEYYLNIISLEHGSFISRLKNKDQKEFLERDVMLIYEYIQEIDSCYIAASIPLKILQKQLKEDNME